MRTDSWFIAVALSFLLVIGPPAGAQETSTGSAITADADSTTASLAIYFELSTHARSLTVAPGETFQFLIVAEHAARGVTAWETRVLVDERLMVLKRQADGMDFGADPNDWRVGLGKDCLRGDAVVLATYTARAPDNEARDLVLGLAPIEKGSFDPPAPGYVSCVSADDLRPFAYSDTCAVVNPDRVRLPGQSPAGPHFEPERAQGGR